MTRFVLLVRGCSPRFTPHIKFMFYLYVLQSLKDKKMYIGSTNNLRRRFSDHNMGKIFSTKHRMPFQLVYYEAYKSERDARSREKNLKLRSKAFAQLKRRLVYSLGKFGVGDKEEGERALTALRTLGGKIRSEHE